MTTDTVTDAEKAVNETFERFMKDGSVKSMEDHALAREWWALKKASKSCLNKWDLADMAKSARARYEEARDDL